MVTITALIALLACAGIYLGWRLSAAQARVSSSSAVQPWWHFLTYLFFGSASVVFADLFIFADGPTFLLSRQIIPIIAFSALFTLLAHRQRD
ncbi:MAG: hypothetical protein AB8B93_01225 [Pseudomonadales bacterium]